MASTNDYQNIIKSYISTNNISKGSFLRMLGITSSSNFNSWLSGKRESQVIEDIISKWYHNQQSHQPPSYTPKQKQYHNPQLQPLSNFKDICKTYQHSNMIIFVDGDQVSHLELHNIHYDIPIFITYGKHATPLHTLRNCHEFQAGDEKNAADIALSLQIGMANIICSSSTIFVLCTHDLIGESIVNESRMFGRNTYLLNQRTSNLSIFIAFQHDNNIQQIMYNKHMCFLKKWDYIKTYLSGIKPKILKRSIASEIERAIVDPTSPYYGYQTSDHKISTTDITKHIPKTMIDIMPKSHGEYLSFGKLGTLDDYDEMIMIRKRLHINSWTEFFSFNIICRSLNVILHSNDILTYHNYDDVDNDDMFVHMLQNDDLRLEGLLLDHSTHDDISHVVGITKADFKSWLNGNRKCCYASSFYVRYHLAIL